VLNAARLVTVTDNLFRPLKGGSCKLDVTALRAGNLTIKVYTATGALVKTLFDGPVAAGPATYNWAGDTAGGRVAASGVYIIQVRGPGVGKTLKVVLIK
jgi:flagellar hook assembly protein FlgD